MNHIFGTAHWHMTSNAIRIWLAASIEIQAIVISMAAQTTSSIKGCRVSICDFGMRVMTREATHPAVAGHITFALIHPIGVMIDLVQILVFGVIEFEIGSGSLPTFDRVETNKFRG